MATSQMPESDYGPEFEKIFDEGWQLQTTASFWQGVKQDFAPAWFLRAFPVKWKEVEPGDIHLYLDFMED